MVAVAGPSGHTRADLEMEESSAARLIEVQCIHKTASLWSGKSKNDQFQRTRNINPNCECQRAIKPKKAIFSNMTQLWTRRMKPSDYFGSWLSCHRTVE